MCFAEKSSVGTEKQNKYEVIIHEKKIRVEISWRVDSPIKQ